MNTKAMNSVKVKITLLLLVWAIICITSLSERSSLLRSRLKAEFTPKSLLEYFAMME